jgi:hypothetical protein
MRFNQHKQCVMERYAPNRGRGWRCNGKQMHPHDKNCQTPQCVSGLSEFRGRQEGLQSYRCSSCDFDLCLDCALVSGEYQVPTTIFGQVFVQGGEVGVASYHFESQDPTTGAYINYSNAPSSWILDNGQAPSEKKYFEEWSYDEE